MGSKTDTNGRKKARSPKQRLIYWLSSLVSIFLVPVFLAGFLAAYVDPTLFWSLQLFGVWLSPVVYAVLILLLVWIYQRRWVWATVHAVAIALYMLRLLGAGWGLGGSAFEEADFTVITQNLPSDFGAGFNEIVSDLQPDIIGLQECFIWRDRSSRGWDMTEKLMPLYESLNYVPAVPLYSGGNGLTGQPVFVKNHQAEALDRFPDSMPRGSDSFASRVPVLIDGRRVIVYSVHLASFRMGADKPWNNLHQWPDLGYWRRVLRSYQEAYHLRAEQVGKLKQRLDQEVDPVILMGDFNSTMHNWSYHQLSDGMTDVFLVAGTGSGGTFSTSRPWLRIDFILVSPHFEVIEAETLPPTTSDHLGVLARLKWRTESS